MTAPLSEFQELYNQFEALRIREAINYEKMNEALISHHSTAIEGSSLTEDESRLLLTEGLTAKGKPLSDHNMVKDHQAALEMVAAMAKRKERITPAMVQAVAAVVMKNTGSVIHAAAGTFDSSKGDWRKVAVAVGTRYFTNHQSIERDVTVLCGALDKANQAVKELTDVYDLAFDAHFQLVSIHPFADGNGRTSRLLMNYILAYHDKPLAMLYAEDKQDYYAALEKAREQDPANLQPVRDFLYGQQSKFFKEEIAKITVGNKYKSEQTPLLRQILEQPSQQEQRQANRFLSLR